MHYSQDKSCKHIHSPFHITFPWRNTVSIKYVIMVNLMDKKGTQELSFSRSTSLIILDCRSCGHPQFFHWKKTTLFFLYQYRLNGYSSKMEPLLQKRNQKKQIQVCKCIEGKRPEVLSCSLVKPYWWLHLEEKAKTLQASNTILGGMYRGGSIMFCDCFTTGGGSGLYTEVMA